MLILSAFFKKHTRGGIIMKDSNLKFGSVELTIESCDSGIDDLDYSIPDEGACSPEFSEGCILCD